jgi:hypothetical protein
LRAAEYLPLSQLGTTDDCGFSPFADDPSTSRDITFEKIRARVEGTRMAAVKLKSFLNTSPEFRTPLEIHGRAKMVSVI